MTNHNLFYSSAAYTFYSYRSLLNAKSENLTFTFLLLSYLDSFSCSDKSSQTQFSDFFFLHIFQGCSWQHVNVTGSFPDNMVRGGVDVDGAVIYIGRAFHEGDMLPAKVIPDKNSAFVCYGGEEHFKEDVEVLRAGTFVWEFSSAGNIPEGAVSCGQTADGELLYVGRCLHQGTQTPG